MVLRRYLFILWFSGKTGLKPSIWGVKLAKPRRLVIRGVEDLSVMFPTFTDLKIAIWNMSSDFDPKVDFRNMQGGLWKFWSRPSDSTKGPRSTFGLCQGWPCLVSIRATSEHIRLTVHRCSMPRSTGGTMHAATSGSATPTVHLHISHGRPSLPKHDRDSPSTIETAEPWPSSTSKGHGRPSTYPRWTGDRVCAEPSQDCPRSTGAKSKVDRSTGQTRIRPV